MFSVIAALCFPEHLRGKRIPHFSFYAIVLSTVQYSIVLVAEAPKSEDYHEITLEIIMELNIKCKGENPCHTSCMRGCNDFVRRQTKRT